MPKPNDGTLSDAVDALTRSDVEAAVQVYRAAGASFFDEPTLTAELRSVLTLTPQVLSDCPSKILQPLRVAAGLMLLTGGSSIRRFIAIDGDYHYRYEPEVVAHLLVGHAAFLSRRSSLAAVGITNLQVLNSGRPDECATCREIARKRFNVETVPELPLVDCTCPEGCKCVLIGAR